MSGVALICNALQVKLKPVFAEMFVEKFPEWFELEYRLIGKKPAHIFFGDKHLNIVGLVSVQNHANCPFACILYENQWFAPIEKRSDYGYYVGGTYRLSESEWGRVKAGSPVTFPLGFYTILLN